ncbi:uncharacterized protein J7T54_003811 [Emericellopsis cladophorae]|uniref:Uncharacterized protein n=1 Tax=Emericellopsis cladophorae TaxID=2686198 RepID=A0A9P9XUE1_9HYPO|nr:uncharacterized protein J7T54_003811 [Emericellopsis cladophorae]KAI6777705.1 hypothetical protein J7T54_003811 [Emericellopsis cladophorae]
MTDLTTNQFSTLIIRSPLAQIHQPPWKKLRVCGSSYGKNSAYAKKSSAYAKKSNDDAKTSNDDEKLLKNALVYPNR